MAWTRTGVGEGLGREELIDDLEENGAAKGLEERLRLGKGR